MIAVDSIIRVAYQQDHGFNATNIHMCECRIAPGFHDAAVPKRFAVTDDAERDRCVSVCFFIVHAYRGVKIFRSPVQSDAQGAVGVRSQAV